MDASDYGVGGVLSQIQDDGRERVIAYGRRVLSKAERRYCVTRRELLAVVTFTQHFRPYLLLWRLYEEESGTTRKQLVVPQCLQTEILNELHAGAAGAHLGD